MALLEVNGSQYPIEPLGKRIRDNVCWTDGTGKPWQKCSFWLVLRVDIKRLLYTMLGNKPGRVYYKFLICVVLSNLLIKSLDHLHPKDILFLRAKLCRHIIKLKVEKERASVLMHSIYKSIIPLLEPTFQKATQAATKQVEIK